MLRKRMGKDDLRDRLSRIPGVDVIRHIKDGPGVVGRTARVAIAASIVFLVGIWAVHSSPFYVLALVILFTLLIAGYFGVSFWYANKYPDFSTLDGRELVEYRRLEQATKDKGVIIDEKAQPSSNPSLIERS